MKKHDAKANRRRKVRERALAEERRARQERLARERALDEERQARQDRLVREEERMVHEARMRQLAHNPQSPVINTVLAIMDQAHLQAVREAGRRGLLSEEDIGRYDGGY